MNDIILFLNVFQERAVYLAACLGRDGIQNDDRFDFRYPMKYRKSNRSTLGMPSLPRQAARYELMSS